MHKDEPRPTLSEADWKQVELGIDSLIRDVAGSLPRDGRGRWALDVSQKRTRIHAVAVESRMEWRPDPWPHLGMLLDLARRTHAYKVLATRLTRLLNELPGLYLGDLDAEVARAVRGESARFDEEFVAPLLGEGLRRLGLGLPLDAFVQEATLLLRRLREWEQPRFKFWWLLANLRIASNEPIGLAEDIRLHRLSVEEKADFVSDLADYGFAPSIRELQMTDWRFEVELPGGEGRFPGWPSDESSKRARDLLERLQWTLALAGSGLVQVRWRDHDPLQWFRHPWMPRNALRPQKAALAPPFVEDQVLDLDVEGVQRVQAIWSTISAMPADADLEAILVRHTRGCRQLHPLDRARDLISCLERMLLQGEAQGKGRKMALRAAVLLHPPGPEARQVREYLEQLYRYRNDDLHDADAPSTADLETIAAVARAAVLRILTMAVSRNVTAAELRRRLAAFADSPEAGRGRFEL